MAETPEQPDQSNQFAELLQRLRRKEGSWVEWGQACSQLQKAGYRPQQIFEETGIEPVQQNQIMVAAQVYTSLVNTGVSEAVLNYYQQKGSDRLYEYRILTQTERASAAEYTVAQNLDADEAKELAKALKEISRIRTLPEGFSHSPGDALAYQCWKVAREQSDLQERSRLIAKGLKYAQTPETRKQIELLLTDFSVSPKRPAPQFPYYRFDSEEEQRIIAVVGEFPLTPQDLHAVPLIDETEPFKIVKFSGSGALVAIPGWQVVRNAEDPVAIIAAPERLPNSQSGQAESVLVVVERSDRQWTVENYFLVDIDGQLEIHWFDAPPDVPILGKVLLAIRPRKIFDVDHAKDLWQIEE